MLTLTEAMDEDERVGVNEALKELREHHNTVATTDVGNKTWICEISDPKDIQFVCPVKDGMVSSRAVMTWLGY